MCGGEVEVDGESSVLRMEPNMGLCLRTLINSLSQNRVGCLTVPLRPHTFKKFLKMKC